MTVKFEELEPSELDDAELREMAFALPLTSGTVRRRVDEFTRADEHP
jgi:hypothetical protein